MFILIKALINWVRKPQIKLSTHVKIEKQINKLFK